MCDLVSRCNNNNKVIVIHKYPGGVNPDRAVHACRPCAAKIGDTRGGKLIDHPRRESRFYKITEMQETLSR